MLQEVEARHPGMVWIGWGEKDKVPWGISVSETWSCKALTGAPCYWTPWNWNKAWRPFEPPSSPGQHTEEDKQWQIEQFQNHFGYSLESVIQAEVSGTTQTLPHGGSADRSAKRVKVAPQPTSDLGQTAADVFFEQAAEVVKKAISAVPKFSGRFSTKYYPTPSAAIMLHEKGRRVTLSPHPNGPEVYPCNWLDGFPEK